MFVSAPYYYYHHYYYAAFNALCVGHKDGESQASGPTFKLDFLHVYGSVLWRCWLGGRKGIRPVKNWVVRCWHSYQSGARWRLAYGPADATATHRLFASVKFRLVLPLWYRLTRVVADKGLLNARARVCVYGSWQLQLAEDWNRH